MNFILLRMTDPTCMETPFSASGGILIDVRLWEVTVGWKVHRGTRDLLGTIEAVPSVICSALSNIIVWLRGMAE
jgi:hypothetical protein